MLQKKVSPTPWLKSRENLLEILPKNGAVAEIGVQSGDFSAEILLRNRPSSLYLIDCWQEQKQEIYPGDPANINQTAQESLYQLVIDRFILDKRVVIIRAFSDKASTYFNNNSLDWVFIDANHTYDAVKNDLQLWFTKIKKGGFLCGHDYTYSNYFEIGVVRAVNEFVLKNGLKITYLTNEPHGWISYAIRKE